MPLVRQPKDFDDESETFEHCGVLGSLATPAHAHLVDVTYTLTGSPGI
jgi:hypothetical protein